LLEEEISLKCNDFCPYCQGNELLLDVEVYITSVVVNKDGYDITSGTEENIDELALTCGNCGSDIPVDWIHATICDKCGYPQEDLGGDIQQCTCNMMSELEDAGMQLSFLPREDSSGQVLFLDQNCRCNTIQIRRSSQWNKKFVSNWRAL